MTTTIIGNDNISASRPAAAEMLSALGTSDIAIRAIDLVGDRPWTHPGTGEVRYYLDHDTSVEGLMIRRYNTGNVASASLDGDRVSNAEGGRVLAGKSWLTIEVGCVALHSTRARRDTHDRVVAWVKAALDVSGTG